MRALRFVAVTLAVAACGGTVILGGAPAEDDAGGGDASFDADSAAPIDASDAGRDAPGDADAGDAAPDARTCTALDASALVFDAGDGAPAVGAPELLASDQAAPTSLRLVNGVLYWTCSAGDAPDAGAIVSLQTDACPNETRVVASGLTGPYSLRVDGTTVYWVTDGTNAANHVDSMVQSAPLASVDGGAPTAIATARLRATDLEIGGGRVFWTEQGEPPYTGVPDSGGGVYDCPTTGCTGDPDVIVNGGTPIPQYRAFAAASDGTNLYFTVLGSPGIPPAGYTDGALYKCPIAGCAGNVTQLTTGERVAQALTAQGPSLFWTTAGWPPQTANGTVMTCTAASCDATKTQLAGARLQTDAIATDGTSVYFSELGGVNTVSRVPVGGGPVTTLLHATSGIYGIAVDATYVYVALYGTGANDGAIARLPK